MKWGFCLFFIISFLQAGNTEKEKAVWTQYARGGLSRDAGTNGGHGYYRVKRTTSFTFQDLRLFGYALEDESYIYIRYKNSYKFVNFMKLYNFTTISYQKNTRADLALRYHYNQGFGYFLSDYNIGHVTVELGLAYDMSDYLNDTRKTSYFKSGLFWDHTINKTSIKLDAEMFKQISDIVEADLSRFQLFTEVKYEISKSLAIIAGFEQDIYTEANLRPQSYYISLGWKR